MGFPAQCQFSYGGKVLAQWHCGNLWHALIAKDAEYIRVLFSGIFIEAAAEM